MRTTKTLVPMAGVNIRVVQSSQPKHAAASYDERRRSAMEIQEALTIVRALADGVNPENGELLTVDVVYQYAPVVRALHRAVGALEIMKERERSRRTLPGSGAKSWSRSEDAQVCEELRRGIDFHQIAKTHNRSIGSIITRLVKLGQIGPNSPLDLFGPKVA
jgi:hypothetical protein